jgi:hypothetical protein
MKSFHQLMILFLSFFILSCTKGGTYSLSLRYDPPKEFPSLKQKIGPTLALAPFKDERSETLYIGFHTPFQGGPSYFKSRPFPLEKAIRGSLEKAIFSYGVKTVTIADWDESPESLSQMEVDSVLTIRIKRFWIEGRAGPFRTNVMASIHLLIHLGVKKEGKVFTKNLEVDKEMTLARLTPERMEEIMRQILTDLLDSFFSNPY